MQPGTTDMALSVLYEHCFPHHADTAYGGKQWLLGQSVCRTVYLALYLAHKLQIRNETMVVLPSAEQQIASKPTYKANIAQLLHWI